jgi:hypothetical protein
MKTILETFSPKEVNAFLILAKLVYTMQERDPSVFRKNETFPATINGTVYTFRWHLDRIQLVGRAPGTGIFVENPAGADIMIGHQRPSIDGDLSTDPDQSTREAV